METVTQLNWFVFYTFPRAEKVVYRELMNLNYDVFLPMTKTMKVWKNRQKKRISKVLFPNYIFVYTSPSKLYSINCLPKVVTFLHNGGIPSTVSPKEIEDIKKLLSLDQEIELEPQFFEGEKVRINGGPLIGYEGILVNQKGKTRFALRLKETNYTALIEMSTNLISKAI